MFCISLRGLTITKITKVPDQKTGVFKLDDKDNIKTFLSCSRAR